MDKAFYFNDVKSFECSSPSELDRRFHDEQSLLSALDQLSTSKVSNDSVSNNGTDARLSIFTSLSTSLDPLSPCPVLSVSNINDPVAEGSYLSLPLQEKSSTPLILIQKKTSKGEQSYSDLVGSQISWDVSIIKSESPKVAMEQSISEGGLSLKQSTSSSQTGLSP